MGKEIRKEGMDRERCGWEEEGVSRPSAGGIERYRSKVEVKRGETLRRI